jgi:hypothetical protein
MFVRAIVNYVARTQGRTDIDFFSPVAFEDVYGHSHGDIKRSTGIGKFV